MKKIRKYQNKIHIVLLLSIVLTFSFLATQKLNSYNINRNSASDQGNSLTVNSSSYWNLTNSPITINGIATGVGAHNWTWAASQPWCSGDGNYSHPYIIENVFIDALNASNSLSIINSDKYFKIKNCSFINSGYDGFSFEYYGLYLEEVSNGVIYNNNCSENFQGMRLENCDNCSLIANNITRNFSDGILLMDCYNCSISDNIFSNNEFYGLETGSSNKIVIKNNNFDESYGGIYVYGHNNSILGNTINYANQAGITMHENNGTIIRENTIRSHNTHNFSGDSNRRGIYSKSSHQCDIIDNTIEGFRYAISFQGSSNILVSQNNIQTSQYGIFGPNLCNITNNFINNIDYPDFYFSYGMQIGDLNLIRNNQIRFFDIGIYLNYADNNSIISNTIIFYQTCIKEENCEGNIIQGNTCQEAGALAIPGFNMYFIITLIFFGTIFIITKNRRNLK